MKILTAYGWFPVKVKKRDRKRTGGPVKHISIKNKAEFAEHLRRNMTPAEKRLWFDLKPRGFLPQQIIRGYIPDFVHSQKKLIIEVDGSVHDYLKDRDAQKDDRLSASGYKVLRFTNRQVFFEGKSVLAKVDAMLK